MHPLKLISLVNVSLGRSSFWSCACQHIPSWGWQQGSSSSHKVYSPSGAVGFSMLVFFTRCIIQHLRYLLSLDSHPFPIWTPWGLAHFFAHSLSCRYPTLVFVPPCTSCTILKDCLRRAYLFWEPFVVPIYCPRLWVGSNQYSLVARLLGASKQFSVIRFRLILYVLLKISRLAPKTHHPFLQRRDKFHQGQALNRIPVGWALESASSSCWEGIISTTILYSLFPQKVIVPTPSYFLSSMKWGDKKF